MELTAALAPEKFPSRGQSLWGRAWYRFRRKKVAMAALITILVIYSAGFSSPLIAPYGYNDQDLDHALEGPSALHWMGTDRLGRDLFSRILWGARTAAVISVVAVASGTVLGVILGGLGGYLGRWVDTLLMRIGDVLFAFPDILLVILIAATLKPRVLGAVRALEDATGVLLLKGCPLLHPDYLVVFGALALVAWPGMARIVRGQVLSVKESQYVEAAQALGATTGRIIRKHLMPNVISPIVVMVSMALGGAVTSELVLSWFGLGITPPCASWGRMMWESAGVLRTPFPHLLLAPAAVVGMVIVAFNLLGDGLNDVLNPRTR